MQSEPARPRMRVLIAEDNAVIQSVLKFMLVSWSYEPLIASDGSEAWKILQSDSAPRIAILDWNMPGIDGLEICRRLRASASEPYTYVLLLTARTEAADLVVGIEAGADDYLRKPFNAPELRARVHAGSRIIKLQEQLLAAREALREQATRDALTGLFNHACILKELDRELARANQKNRPLAVLNIDIDRFRQINDSFGHPAGDEVLRETGRRLRAAAPEGASIGRYCGKEFLVVLPGCDAASANAHAARFRNALEVSIFSAGAASFPVSCSVGVACRPTGGSCSSDILLREADEALVWAKRESRNPPPQPEVPLVLRAARM
jgi:two-component system cell cycle response regulator